VNRTFGDFGTWWRLSAGSSDPLIALELRLDRTCDRERDCYGECIGRIGPGTGPHAYAIPCSICGRHCGWLSKAAAALLRDLMEIGRLSSAPVLRDHGIRP
jgi:hypothetical protein